MLAELPSCLVVVLCRLALILAARPASALFRKGAQFVLACTVHEDDTPGLLGSAGWPDTGAYVKKRAGSRHVARESVCGLRVLIVHAAALLIERPTPLPLRALVCRRTRPTRSSAPRAAPACRWSTTRLWPAARTPRRPPSSSSPPPWTCERNTRCYCAHQVLLIGHAAPVYGSPTKAPCFVCLWVGRLDNRVVKTAHSIAFGFCLYL